MERLLWETVVCDMTVGGGKAGAVLRNHIEWNRKLMKTSQCI